MTEDGAAPRSLGVKIVRFGIVGVANSLIDLAVFTLAVLAGAWPVVANVVAWVAAVAFSYFANSRWSFVRGPAHREARSMLAFFTLGALISLGVSTAAIVSLAGVIGLFPAKLAGIVAAAILNFLAARWSIETLGVRRTEPPGGADKEYAPTAPDRPRRGRPEP